MRIFGEAVAAFIELKPGTTLEAAEVLEHSRARIAGYKKPKHVFFLAALPRNPTGKVLKTDLRVLAATELMADKVSTC